MKRIFFVLLIIMSLYSRNGISASEEDPYTWDFGGVKEGEILVHTFVYKNDSQNVLNINDLQTSCSCTVSEVSSRVIQPGGSVEIKVSVDSAGRKGEIKQYVYVVTDSAADPIKKFTIRASITAK
jgi:hypothetical protein